MTDSKKLETKIKIRGKLVPEEIISMVHEAIDTINNFLSIVTRIYEKGADAGFSREEISQQIIRPIANQRGLNKDQVYYLTHRPEIQEKSKRQYEELKENQKTRNIPSPAPALQEALPAEVQALAPAPSGELEDRKNIVLPETKTEIETPLPKPEVAVEDFTLDDIHKYDRIFLVQIIHYLYHKLEQSEQQTKENEEKVRRWDKDQASMKEFLVQAEKLTDAELGNHFRRWTQGAIKSKPKAKKQKKMPKLKEKSEMAARMLSRMQ